MLEDSARAYDFRPIVLRYFNVAGADPQGRTGNPRPSDPSHQACLSGGARPRQAFGRVRHRLPHPDGTGVRDYIHVTDLADAHLLALDALRAGSAPASYNCGYGRGLSVRQVIDGMEAVLGRRLSVKEGPRRPRSAHADIRPDKTEDRSEMAAKARRSGRDHPLGAGMGTPLQHLTDALASLLRRAYFTVDSWGPHNCPPTRR